MWLTDRAVRPVDRPGPLTEPEIAAEFAPVVRAGGDAIGMVVDVRAPADRSGATANYRLQRALGLSRAAPVACWAGDRVMARHTLEHLVATLAPDRCALVVASATGAAHLVAAALVWPQPPGPVAIRIDRAEPASTTEPVTGNGFVDLLMTTTGAAKAEETTP